MTTNHTILCKSATSKYYYLQYYLRLVVVFIISIFWTTQKFTRVSRVEKRNEHDEIIRERESLYLVVLFRTNYVTR